MPFGARIVVKTDKCSVAFHCLRLPDELLQEPQSVGHSSLDHVKFPGLAVSQLYGIGDRTSRHTFSEIVRAATKLAQENDRLKSLLADVGNDKKVAHLDGRILG